MTLSQAAEDGGMATPGIRVLVTLKSVPRSLSAEMCLMNALRKEVAGEGDGAQDRVACVGDFEWLQRAGMKDSRAEVGTTGPEVRQEPGGDARGFPVGDRRTRLRGRP